MTDTSSSSRDSSGTEIKPNKDRIRLWAEALESGEFHQGRWSLAQMSPTGEIAYCCLGVACEVAKRNGLPVNVTAAIGGRTLSYDLETAVLPSFVRDWYGLPADPLLGVDPLGAVTAISANDNRGLSFVEIAQVIRERYLNPSESAA